MRGEAGIQRQPQRTASAAGRGQRAAEHFECQQRTQVQKAKLAFSLEPGGEVV